MKIQLGIKMLQSIVLPFLVTQLLSLYLYTNIAQKSHGRYQVLENYQLALVNGYYFLFDKSNLMSNGIEYFRVLSSLVYSKYLYQTNFPSDQALAFNPSANPSIFIKQADCTYDAPQNQSKIMYNEVDSPANAKTAFNNIYPVYVLHSDKSSQSSQLSPDFLTYQICFPDGFYMQYPAYRFSTHHSFDTQYNGQSPCTYRDWYIYAQNYLNNQSLFYSKQYNQTKYVYYNFLSSAHPKDDVYALFDCAISFDQSTSQIQYVLCSSKNIMPSVEYSANNFQFGDQNMRYFFCSSNIVQDGLPMPQLLSYFNGSTFYHNGEYYNQKEYKMLRNIIFNEPDSVIRGYKDGEKQMVQMDSIQKQFFSTTVYQKYEYKRYRVQVTSYDKEGQNYYMMVQSQNIKSRWDNDLTVVRQIVVTTWMNTLLKDLNIGQIEEEVRQKLMNIYIFTGVALLLLLLLAYIQTVRIYKPMNILLEQLKMVQMTGENKDFDKILDKKKNDINFLEIDRLYELFKQLFQIFKKQKNKSVKNQTVDLVNQIQGLQIFQQLNQTKGIGICHNNIGNIHFENDRRQDAIESYEESIKQINKLIEENGGYSSQDKAMTRFYNDAVKVNRTYQLTCALIKRQTFYGYQKDSQRILDYLRDCKQGIEAHGVVNHKLISIYIKEAEIIQTTNTPLYDNLLVKISSLLIQLESRDYQASLNSKQKYFNYIIQSHYLSKQEIDKHFILLKQRYNMLSAYSLMEQGNLKKAANKYFECLRSETICDPAVRLECLRQLKKIFEGNNCPKEAKQMETFLDLLTSKRHMDIVFLLDMSESMDYMSKKLYAIREILRFFDDYMLPQDKIAFMRFNQNFFVDFELQERGEGHNVYLRNVIQKADDNVPQGSTYLYDAINRAMNLCQKKNNYKNTQYILVCTDGDDSGSKVLFHELVARLQQADINLIIIGIAIDEQSDYSLRLKQLCRATKQGVFIRTPKDLYGIQAAFEQISSKVKGRVYKEKLIYEEIY